MFHETGEIVEVWVLMKGVTKIQWRKPSVEYKTLSEEYFIDAPTKMQTDPSGNDSDRMALRNSYSVWEIPLVLGVGTSLA